MYAGVVGVPDWAVRECSPSTPMSLVSGGGAGAGDAKAGKVNSNNVPFFGITLEVLSSPTRRNALAVSSMTIPCRDSSDEFRAETIRK